MLRSPLLLKIQATRAPCLAATNSLGNGDDRICSTVNFAPAAELFVCEKPSVPIAKSRTTAVATERKQVFAGFIGLTGYLPNPTDAIQASFYTGNNVFLALRIPSLRIP